MCPQRLFYVLQALSFCVTKSCMSDFNPLKPETFDSPHEVYERLRRECPVAHSDAWDGFWAFMKHEDVANAAADFDTYLTSVQNVVPKVSTTGRRPPLHLDPPEHTPYRRALAPTFSEKRIAGFEPVIERICNSLLDNLVAKGGGDICSEFSAPMPILVFAEWMNLPRDQVESLGEIGRRYNIAVQSADMEETQASSKQLYDIARALIAERQAHPLDPNKDAVSSLLAARHNGEPLPEDLIVGTIRQVLVVGIIAPTVLFGSICVHLSRDTALQDKLRAELSLIPAAIEEFLRLYTPYRGFARTPSRDVKVRSKTIKKDEPIALVYASANRDEDVFECPAEFRLNRPNIKESLAFGRGPHMCIGASLGRLEMQVALRTLLARTSRFSLAGDIKPTRMPEIGALSVPLKFE